ncbi:hypothetical protein FQR65_LT08521 [Abscondita terminalis]|nr:hypothetical protein FQR65_LT08521 [Abscondita terminalis]
MLTPIHGSRAPTELEMYPNDPHIEYWKKIGFGELTNLGKQQSVQLGKIIRKRYRSFLSKDYNPDEVLTKSTNFNRTLETAKLVLDGIFDNSTSTPYVIQWKELSKDFDLTNPYNYCTAYINEAKYLTKTRVFINNELKYKKVFKLMSEKSGERIENIIDAYFLFQVLYSEKYINLPNPDWDDNLYNTLQEIASYQHYNDNFSLKLKRLGGGNTVKKIIMDMKKKSTNTFIPNNRKILLHSVHDVNIAYLLAAMNLFTLHIPNYNAAIIVELHSSKTSSKYYVKVFYIKHVQEKATAMFITDCGYSCELNKFEDILRPYLPLNYTKECESEVLLDEDDYNIL